jgi:DNA-directed RNA polymerase subunit beta'
MKKFDFLQIKLASPKQIKKWAQRTLINGHVLGEIQKPETINYRTLKPEIAGLFCEQIFGPTKNWECLCGYLKGIKMVGITCPKCGVDATDSRVRRHRMGYINLIYPVSHLWYVKGVPSYVALLLNVDRDSLRTSLYSYVEADFIRTSLENLDLQYELDLAKLELFFLVEQQRKKHTKNGATSHDLSFKEKRIMKRIRLLENFISTKTNPSWMILSVIPVIPPGLRPMIILEGGKLISSDLNELYKRVITRNNRLKRCFEIWSPNVVLQNEKRILQEAVDALIDNASIEKKAVGLNKRVLKSLSDLIVGKQGRFRQNLLGKRVDYSARSVIVVGPTLSLHQCGIPYELALGLFKPFLIHELLAEGFTSNLQVAKSYINQKDKLILPLLEKTLKGFPIILNRAPTLHRLGVQAFEPVIVSGRSIRLHPLVCSAFNADFDGDQMAVHLPLSLAAQSEAYLLMLSVNNFISPATGEPILVPSQEMVLGCHYLTLDLTLNARGANNYFSSVDDVLSAYEHKQITLHTNIWVRIKETQEISTENYSKTKFKNLEKASNYQIRHHVLEKTKTTYISTTPGKIIVNNLLKTFFHKH